jgi:hypothetical protein
MTIKRALHCLWLFPLAFIYGACLFVAVMASIAKELMVWGMKRP